MEVDRDRASLASWRSDCWAEERPDPQIVLSVEAEVAKPWLPRLGTETCWVMGGRQSSHPVVPVGVVEAILTEDMVLSEHPQSPWSVDMSSRGEEEEVHRACQTDQVEAPDRTSSRAFDQSVVKGPSPGERSDVRGLFVGATWWVHHEKDRLFCKASREDAMVEVGVVAACLVAAEAVWKDHRPC